MKLFNFNSLVLVMLIFMAGTFFASCGGDDDNNDDITNNGGGNVDDGDNQSSYAKMIVGDWTVYYDDDGLCKVEVTFTSQGQYIVKDYYMQGNGTWSSPSEYSGTYSIKGRTINVVEKTDKSLFAGEMNIVYMADDSFIFDNKEFSIKFKGEKMTSNTISPIVGSWKTTWGSTENGVFYPDIHCEVLTFSSDGTGFDYFFENGCRGLDYINYVYDSANRTLTITNERNGYKDKYKVKSLSSNKLVIVYVRDNGTEADEEVYYRI